MCGIAGIIGAYKESVLDAMLNSQQHRGPDATAKYFDIGCAALGHNRLAIIDLSEQSNQPFIDHSGRYILVFNGEIYNYIELKKELQGQYDFKTESDTEVLLAAFIVYGTSCLEKLNGMFAFAIWDNQGKRLFAARDRFGVKPFYYTLLNNTFYFSSEIKALHVAGIPKEANEKVWVSYFAYGSYGMPNETFWEGVAQLPGGHFLEIDSCQSEFVEAFSDKRIIIKKWYCFEEEVAKQPKNLTFEQAQEQYVALLKDSIQLRFRADVPVGFNISGGLDSSVLLALVNLQENCKDEFNSKRGLRQAQTDSVLERQGENCKDEFNSKGGLRQAQTDSGLERQGGNCQDEFDSKRGLRQVQTDSVLERQGENCQDEFNSKRGLRQAQTDSGLERQGENCQDEFDNKRGLRQAQTDSVLERQGENCKDEFDSKRGLRQVQTDNVLERQGAINAYTFYTNNLDYDEFPWVEQMITKTNNPLTRVLLQANEVPAFAQKMAWQQEEPFGGIPTLAYAKLFEQARKDHILVLLDGQGMDEQWAGYDYYIQNNEATIQGVLDSPYKITMLSDSFLAKAEKPMYPKPFEDEVLNKQYRDLFYTKIPRALRFNDRISMTFSTELREPFLDYRLVELAFSLPLDFKIRKGQTKYMLREIASEYLAADLVFAPKRALQTPQREWLASDLKEWVRECFTALENSVYAPWFNKESLEDELRSFFEGNNQSSFHIWQCISLCLLET